MSILRIGTLIITGKDLADHLSNLDKVFARIEYGFRINQSKCSLLQQSVEYLGFIVDKNGVHTSASKTKAIVDMPNPTNVSQLRSFLGMVNHYAKFIRTLNDRLAPFYTLLQKNVEWEWPKTCAAAFSSIKKTLTCPVALTHYDPTVSLVMVADASNIGVEAVIYQRYSDGTEKVIAHASKTLTPTERNYAQIEIEALALIYAVQKFDQLNTTSHSYSWALICYSKVLTKRRKMEKLFSDWLGQADKLYAFSTTKLIVV